MARWTSNELNPALRDRIESEALAQVQLDRVRVVNGTLLRADDFLIGKREQLAEAERWRGSPSRSYAAVNTMAAQPWVLRIGGAPVTTCNSAEAWLRQTASPNWAAFGGMSPKPGSAPRGRPPSQS